MAMDSNPTLADFAEAWLRDHCGHRAAYVRRNRRHVLRLYVLPALGSLRLHEIAPTHVAALQRDLLARLAQSSARNAIAVFGEAWKTARRLGLVLGRPHADLVWPRAEWVKPTVFTKDERDVILRAFAKRRPEYLPLVACCFLAGLRPSEACALRWRDLDPERGRLNIERALAAGEVTPGKTARSVRTIEVSPSLVRRLVAARPRVAKPGALMTLTPDAEPVDTQRFSLRIFKPVLGHIGVPYRSFYAARHTYITLALMGGASITHVAQYCGTSVAQIEKSYLSWIGAVSDPMAKRPRRPHLSRLRPEVAFADEPEPEEPAAWDGGAVPVPCAEDTDA